MVVRIAPTAKGEKASVIIPLACDSPPFARLKPAPCGVSKRFVSRAGACNMTAMQDRAPICLGLEKGDLLIRKLFRGLGFKVP